MAEGLDTQDWQPLSVAEVADAMRGVPCRWWIAGGWAIDLFLGRQTRPHADTDVVILTCDQLVVQQHLSAWRLYKTQQPTPSRLAPWPAGQYLAPQTNIHNIWVKDRDGGPWRFQLMLTEDAGDRWVFRRDRRIGGPLSDLGWVDSDGLPVICPEVQLLYKARPADRRAKDQADFEAAVGVLSPAARSWLAGAIETQYGPNHDWLRPLRDM